MIGIFKKIFGTKYDRDVKNMLPIVDKINELYEQYHALSNDELRQKTDHFRQTIQNGLAEIDQEIQEIKDRAASTEDFNLKDDLFQQIDELEKSRNKELEEILKEILPEAFAVVKETERRFKENPTLEVTATEHDRDLASTKDFVTIEGDKAIWKNSWVAGGNTITWDMIPYDVQLIGGMVLHEGKIAEMATGEGKTLVATLPVYLNGLAGRGVHVVTVNDYLAKRDSEWVGPIFQFLMLNIDCIDKYQPHSPDRVNAYNCDITYGTNNEFGFDYLRDNMVRSLDEVVQRKHHYAIIDEVDSVLIDDARTPLIISGPIPEGSEEQEYQELKGKVERLISEQKKLAIQYLNEAKKKIREGITGPKEGEGGLALLRAYRALPKFRPLIKFLSEEGVKVTLQKTENFYMQEQSKNMHLVDAPLFFTIDEKNRQVELLDKGAEYLSKWENDNKFFIMPDIGSELHEIDLEEELTDKEKAEQKDAVIQDFAIKSRRLHAVNQLLKAYALFERDVDYVVIEGQVKIVDEQTGRMMEGRRYSDGLHQALEAKENVKIGELTQTYATVTLQNYFRMYHKLSGMTGTAETEAQELWEIYKLDVMVIPTNRPIIREDKEDLVYKTVKEKYQAVIEEVDKLTQAGRPVLVGTTSVEVSEKLSRMLNLRGIKHNVLNAKQHKREAEIVSTAGHRSAVTIATNMAGRGTDIKISDEVKQAGGLAIVGTERHDSRRVDRQLRGRAGRQGDPGSSQFFVSLEDNLMRMFHSERIAKVMDRMGHKEGDVIQHSMVTKSIERAQKKVEENNFGIRKRLLEYDDVMNIQREAIYKKRYNALSGERLSLDLHTMFSTFTEVLVADHKERGSFETFQMACYQALGMEPGVTQEEFEEMSSDELVDHFQELFFRHYEEKKEQVNRFLLPYVQNVHQNESHYKRISVPYTDGLRQLNIAADIQRAVDSQGETIFKDIEQAVSLTLIDENWKEHLRAMDELKDSVQAASFEQKDPLVIYKMEAYNMFETLIHKINAEVTSYLVKGKLMIEGQEPQLKQAKIQRTDFRKMREGRMSKAEEAQRKAAMSAGGQPQQEKPETFRRTEKKIRRNDPCPCGSGKKFKHCHGKS